MSNPSESSSRLPHVAVLITCYNGKQYLDDLFTSLQSCASSKVKQTIVMVDNASTDGSSEYAREKYPFVDVVRLDPNKGFAGGNNFGWEHIQSHYADVDFVLLLNTDTAVTENWLLPLVTFMHEHPEAGAVQPKIMLHDKPDHFNTVGNRSHYLGFGMMTGYDEIDQGQYDQPRAIAFASGCCVMIRTDVLRLVGLFDETYFMYLEDAELGWKIRLVGYENYYCPDTKIYHKYIANAPYKYYYYLERNRWLLMLSCYRWVTLLLLLPILIFMEFGQLIFSVMVGRLGDKLRGYAYFLLPKNARNCLVSRQFTQGRRKISDGVLLRDAVSEIEIPSGSPWLLRRVASPIMAVYWKLVRRLIR
ncbi:glycosyltransferase family 2 protein [Poriferisphaera sp. WC338]|uniref:glycosyltransferase family 2 protein n=1 Tax=Poriferisphaera sp. WC338 TaxID=3425129 RepID=UPI003D81BA9F